VSDKHAHKASFKGLALGALGVVFDYQTIGNRGSMLMVSASGTAVVIE